MKSMSRFGTCVLGLGLLAGPLSAQRSCPSGDAAYGSIGVRQYRCVGGSCSINMRLLIDGEDEYRGDPYVHSFSTEPHLYDIDPDGPAAGFIEEGDVLVAVDDRLITTNEGGRLLGSLAPGDDVKLTLRRDRQQLNVRLEPESSCQLPRLDVRMSSRSPTLSYSYIDATSDSVGFATSTLGRWTTGFSGDSTWTVSGALSPAWSVLSTGGDSVLRFAPTVWSSTASNLQTGTLLQSGAVRPAVEFGLELSCGDCGWRRTNQGLSFVTSIFPTIDAVEKGGPADLAGMLPGDILIGVDGAPITSGAAGLALGGVEVGESVGFEIRRGDRFLEISMAPRQATTRRQKM